MNSLLRLSALTMLTTSLCAAQSETFKFVASDAAMSDAFGHAVDADGQYALVGARNAVVGGVDMGAVYVYDTTSGAELYKITPVDGGSGDKFGFSLAVENGIAIIGSPHHDVMGMNMVGSAYVYDLSTGMEIGRLVPSTMVMMGHFGISVDIDGNQAAVGAFTRDPLGTDSGEAFVYDWTTNTELFALTASDGVAGDNLGWTIAIDSGKVLVGADLADAAGPDSGAAYIFDANTGAELHKLTSTDLAGGDRFGWKLDLENDTALVSAHKHDIIGYLDAGAVYTFDASTGMQLNKFTATVKSANDEFGYCVDLDGSHIVASAPYNDTATINAGAVYVLDVATGNEEFKLMASDASMSDLYGSSVRLDGDTLLVGSVYDDDGALNAGAAYQIDLAGGVSKFCTVADGSVNNTSMLEASGYDLSMPITLTMTGAPAGQFTYLLIGSGMGVVTDPAGALGDLCLVGGTLSRYSKDLGAIGAGGTFSTDISNSVTGGPGFGIPSSGGASIMAGETWNFQYWHRNSGGALSGFSEAVSVTFK